LSPACLEYGMIANTTVDSRLFWLIRGTFGWTGLPLLASAVAMVEAWWPTKHIHACSVIANNVIFDQRAAKDRNLSLLVHVLAVAIACAPSARSRPCEF